MRSLRLPRPSIRVPLLLGGLFLALFAYAGRNPLTPGGVFDPARFRLDEEQRLRDSLRDPESARFRAGFVASVSSLRVVCGEVNERNETGGFVGYRRFIAAPTFRAREGPVDPEVMDALWSALCRRSP